MSTILETERLVLRRFTPDDAAYMLDQVNQPAFLRFIGDRGVRTLDDARVYLLDRPLASYRAYGFGMWAVERKNEPGVIGMCGLLKRAPDAEVEIGFSLLPPYQSQGYASEAARATLAYGRDVLGLRRITAVTDPDNTASIALLQKLGFRFERMLVDEDTGTAFRLFATLRHGA